MLSRFLLLSVLFVGLCLRAEDKAGGSKLTARVEVFQKVSPEWDDFAWWPLPPQLHGVMRKEEVRDTIQEEIVDVLDNKNLDESFLSLKPDIYIAYYPQVRDSIEGSAPLSAQQPNVYLYPGGYTGPAYRPISKNSKETAFVIDFIRADTRRLFWRSTVVIPLDHWSTRNADLQRAVRALLAAYPARKDS